MTAPISAAAFGKQLVSPAADRAAVIDNSSSGPRRRTARARIAAAGDARTRGSALDARLSVSLPPAAPRATPVAGKRAMVEH